MSESLSRFRIRFSKTEAMRFTGHLDLQRTWERTFRRARLPLAYRQGFNPQARLNLACALPLGITSECELLDAWFEAPLSAAEIMQKTWAALPPGLEIHTVEEVILAAPALQSQIDTAEYRLTLSQLLPDLGERCRAILASPTLLRQRKGKDYDLRALIQDIQVSLPEEDGKQSIVVRLLAREGATGRPEEVAVALGIPPTEIGIHRTKLFFTLPGRPAN